VEEFGASGLAWRRIVEGIIVEKLWKHLVNAAPEQAARVRIPALLDLSLGRQKDFSCDPAPRCTQTTGPGNASEKTRGELFRQVCEKKIIETNNEIRIRL
jgi:hypothetical protein